MEVPLLLLLNGPPAVGKSALARRYLEDHPLALLVEVDRLRTSLGTWREDERSKLLARDLALALIRARLQQGGDVVVPQYLGRTDFIQTLDALARRHHAHFVEVIVVDAEPRLAQRFRDRTRDMGRSGEEHPAEEVREDEVDARIDEWIGLLEAVRDERPATLWLPCRPTLDETYAALVAELAAQTSDIGSRPRVSMRWNAVCLDCSDVDELATFYRDLFGWDVVARDDGWCQLVDPDGGIALNLQAETWYEPPVWPEQPGMQTKMLHLEVRVDDVDEAVRLVERLGGRRAPHQPADRDPAKLRVLLDPAGHPFCLWTD